MTVFESTDDGRWTLREKVCCNLPGNSYQCVNAGYTTDFASIPAFMWIVVGRPETKEFQKPAIIHDYLCDKAWERGHYPTRQFADAAFVYLLEQEGVPYWKRTLMYFGVRACGFVCYSLPKAWVDATFSFFG